MSDYSGRWTTLAERDLSAMSDSPELQAARERVLNEAIRNDQRRFMARIERNSQ